MTTGSDYLLITADRVIDSKGDAPIENGAVLVHDGRIASVGRAAEVSAPDGASVQSHHYPGCTVLPGMVDCHTHHNGFGDGRMGDDLTLLADEILTVQAARNARASLYSGVTTIRENGPKNVTMFRLRDSINAGPDHRPAHGAVWTPGRDHRRAHGVLRWRGNRSQPDKGSHARAYQGGSGLHQDHRNGRKHAHFVPSQTVLYCR